MRCGYGYFAQAWDVDEEEPAPVHGCPEPTAEQLRDRVAELEAALAVSNIKHVPPRSSCNCAWCRCDRQAELIRTAEARVAELEALIEENEWEGYSTDSILCQHCRGNQFGPGHEPACPWGQAAASHRARLAEEAR